MTTYIFNIKVPDGPVFQWYGRNCCHIDVFKVLRAIVPVLLTFDLKQHFEFTHGSALSLRCCVCAAAHSSLLVAACQHDQSLHILLPDHSPEIFDRRGQRTLSCNELLPGVVTLPNKTAQPSFHPPQEGFRHQCWRWHLNLLNEADGKQQEKQLLYLVMMKQWLRTALRSVSTHRNVVSIDVVIIWTAMDNWEFHSRRVIWGDKQGECNENGDLQQRTGDEWGGLLRMRWTEEAQLTHRGARCCSGSWAYSPRSGRRLLADQCQQASGPLDLRVGNKMTMLQMDIDEVDWGLSQGFTSNSSAKPQLESAFCFL